MERILVGVDGSPASHDALGWSADLVHYIGAAVILMPLPASR